MSDAGCVPTSPTLARGRDSRVLTAPGSVHDGTREKKELR
jgi:hypothetical protein